MKILMLSTFPPQKCGVGIYTYDLVSALRKLRNSVVVVSNKPCDADYIIDFKSSSLVSNVKKIIEKEKPDVVHIQYQAVLYSNLLNRNLVSLLKKIKLPTVVTLHEVQYDMKIKKPIPFLKLKALRYMERKVVRNASKVIVHTPNQKNFLRRKYGTNNVECIYMGLHPKNVKKRKLGKNLLFFGMLNHGKGVEYLIRAMKYLPEFKLTVAGRAVSQAYRKKLMKEKEGLSNVNLRIGWISEKDKKRYYEKADIVVLPYVWAPYQSAVLHDAFSYGLPVVVTKAGAVWEIVKLFGCGSVVKPGDLKAIAEGVKKVFDSYSVYKQGVERYRKESNWLNVAKKHIIQYKSLNKLKN